MAAVRGKWWVPPLLVLLLGAALAGVITALGGMEDTILVVNYTKPVYPGVSVEVDYSVQYAVSIDPSDSNVVLEISANCSEEGREVLLGSQGSGYVDLEPGEAVCRIYASNEDLGLPYLPPTSLDPARPGVLNVYFSYPPGGAPLLSGFARLEFVVEGAVVTIGNETLSGPVRVEWFTRLGSQFEDYECSVPCSVRLEPPAYSTSFNVYAAGSGLGGVLYIMLLSVASSLGLAYVLRSRGV